VISKIIAIGMCNKKKEGEGKKGGIYITKYHKATQSFNYYFWIIIFFFVQQGGVPPKTMNISGTCEIILGSFFFYVGGI
jgi:hypothetical protein